MDAKLNPGPAALRDAEKLHAVAKLIRELDIHVLQIADPFDIGLIKRNRAAERDRGKDRNLVRCVNAIDIERRIGLRVPQLLSLGERLSKRNLFLPHAGEDEV